MQWIRLEEKYLSKILNDSSLASGYNFNYKIHYNLLLDIPLSTRPKNKFSFILNDEVHINFGKQIVYNYFDQNRFFTGFKVNITKSNNFQLGYMYQFSNYLRETNTEITMLQGHFIFKTLITGEKKLFSYCSTPLY